MQLCAGLKEQTTVFKPSVPQAEPRQWGTVEAPGSQSFPRPFPCHRAALLLQTDSQEAGEC